jgi:adenine deaminase
MTAEPQDLHDPALRDRAVRAARGQAPFDILITGATLADMATGELRPADLGLVGPLVASVHAPGSRTDAAETLDATGLVAAPGLIDAHMHVESSMVTPRRYAEAVVPAGTTTVCWDPHELGNVSGLAGVRWAVEAIRGLPLRALVLAPSCVPSAPGLERAGADFGPAELEEMLGWPEVAGVAEVMDMRGVLDRSPRMAGIVGAGLRAGKLVCGHARSLCGADLQGFASAGIGSDHEVVSAEDLLEKLRAGFTVELRGSHDYLLPEAVTALAGLPHLPQTLVLCTDDTFPDDLAEKGGMIDLLRRLVRYGMPALQALRPHRPPGSRPDRPRPPRRPDAAGGAGDAGGAACLRLRPACRGSRTPARALAAGASGRGAAPDHEAGAGLAEGFPDPRPRPRRPPAHGGEPALHALG